MKVYTPRALARHTGSKYLGVLVSAKYARSLNEFRRGEVYTDPTGPVEPREKLTTTALEGVSTGSVDFRMVERRKPDQ
jgi:DNA-directed RNA polymerase subunit K/omega